MPTFGDLERALADLYEYRWIIGLGVILFSAGIVALVYRQGWHRYMWEHRVPFAIGGAPIVLIGLFLTWSLASPLFINVTVEEEFPFAAQAVVPDGMERSDVESVMAGMAMVDDSVMVEEMPSTSSMSASSMIVAGTPITAMDSETMSSMMEGMALGATGSDDASLEQAADMIAPAMAAIVEQQGAPVALSVGSFRDADSFHRGSGNATIYSAPGGGLLLRLEDLNVTNGPALHVILSPHPDPMRSPDVKQAGYVDLGPLKGNRGDQNYSIPTGYDVSAAGSVVIYCKPFSVVFSVASLGQA